ncbi:MAG: carboxypeptidase regulatory-like domain-containing protein [Acidobacteriota bacterium]
MLKTLARRALPLLGLLAVATPALAQNGAVKGKVLYQDGSEAAFVTVFLESEQTTWNESAITEDDGSFLFRPVPVGQYKLYAFEAGQSSSSFTGIRVTASRTLEFEIALQPAEALEEKVEISAAVLDLVNTRKTDVSTTLEGEFIESIPLQNKRIQDIVALFAGVTRNGSSDSSDISVGGGTAAQVGYRINGLSINDPVGGGAILDISTSAIQSFRLITGGFQAEYGEQSSGIAEIVTKSGTNEISFQYDLDFRDSRYGAQSLDELDDVAEMWHEILTGANSLIADNLAAGFELLGIDEPSTRADDENPQFRHRVRHAVSTGGPIVRDKLFFHVTVESLANDNGSAFAGGTFYNDTILANARVDWELNDSNKIEINANVDNFENTGFSSTFRTPGTQRDFRETSAQVQLVHKKTYDNGSFIESQFGFTRNYRLTRPSDRRQPIDVEYEIPLPGGFVSYELGTADADDDLSITELRLESTYSQLLGAEDNHDFKTGVSFSHVNADLSTKSATLVRDFRVSDDRNVIGMPGIDIGNVFQFGDEVRISNSAWRASLFAQDRWQVTDNLTLDLGFRADYQNFIGELFLAPRLGFSLDPIGDGQTRIFGNWGVFYDNLFLTSLQWEANPPRLISDLNFGNQFDQRRFNETNIVDIFRQAQATPSSAAGDLETVAYLEPLFRDRFVADDNLTAPTNKAWTIGIERRLPANLRFQMTYQEAKRTHQLTQGTIVQAIPQLPGFPTLRDIVQGSNGSGAYRQWTVELQRPFSNRWQANASYTQARSTGPLAPDLNPLDPTDVVSEDGVLGNDRTHVVKLQGTGELPWKLRMSADFTWQTGQPRTAEVVQSDGRVIRPFGRNTVRLPSSKQLNFAVRRDFQTADGALKLRGEVRLVNALNTLNVFGGVGRFELPEGLSDPNAVPPFKPTIIATGIDVPRSLEFGFTLSF